MGTVVKGPWKGRSPEAEAQAVRPDADTGSDPIDMETWMDRFLFEPEPIPEPKPSFSGTSVVDRLFAAIKNDKDGW
jgi:hypothetical protein